MKRKVKLSLVRIIVFSLVASTVLPSIVNAAAAVGPVGVPDSVKETNEEREQNIQKQEELDRQCDRFKGIYSDESQRDYLRAVNTADKVRCVFNMHIGKQNDLDTKWHKDGFQPRNNATARAKKLGGNPWLEWSDKDGDVGDKQRIGRPREPVRFVLSEVTTRDSSGEIEETATANFEGIVYIFRNEYNPKIAVIMWSRNSQAVPTGLLGAVAGSVGVGLPARSFDRFVYASDCYNVTHDNEGTVIADAAHFQGLGGERDDLYPDDPERDDVKETLKKYKLERVCDVNTGLIAKAIKAVIKSITEALSSFIDTITKWLSDVLDIGTLARVPGVVSAWKTMRDFVNLIFIIVLVLIAFSNILRVDTEKYGVRALLPRLIFAVIAVNFSLLLVQILTNVAFVISQPFLQQATKLISDPPADGSLINPDAGIGQAIVGFFVLLAIIVALLILLFFFVIRIMMIWLLAALSPFVFLFMILPLTRSLASQWWKNALKWIFMGPIAFIILYIAAAVISGGSEQSASSTEDPGFILKIGFFIAAAIAAVLIPLKLGGEVMGYAAGAGKKSLGKGGGFLARKTGAAAAWQQHKELGERRAHERGAKIRKAMNAPLAKATGGRIGGRAYHEASAQLESGEQKEAQLYASNFSGEQLEDMKKSAPPALRKTLGLAQEMRSGLYEERQLGEKGANPVRNFNAKPPQTQSSIVAGWNARTVKEVSGNQLMHLATVNPDHLPANWQELYPGMNEGQAQELAGRQSQYLRQNFSKDAISGALDHNNDGQITALRVAHANGRISPTQINNLKPEDRELYQRRIVEGRDTPLPGRSRPSSRMSGSNTGGGAANLRLPRDRE